MLFVPQLTLADCLLAPRLAQVTAFTKFDLSAYPKLTAYLENMKANVEPFIGSHKDYYAALAAIAAAAKK